MESKVAGNATKPKTKHRKGLWSPEEDRRLRDYILKYGRGCWSSVPANAGLQRNGKSCRLRWINYLRPGLKKGMFTVQEEETILRLHRSLGNKWSQIAQHLPGRTDNEIKNYWHTYLKKKVAKHELAKPHTKSECSSGSADCSSFPDPSHDFSCSPTKPTDLSSLPQSILFAEWLNLNNNINENAHEECSDCYSFYGDDDLIRMICSDSMMECNVNKLQDSLIQNVILSDVDNGASGGAELIDGSYEKMEGPSLESEFLLDFTPRDQICGSDEFTMSSDSMYI